jgi:uracil phosphoribosyltransferase
MHIHNLSENNSILNHFLAQLRDTQVQKDSMRFRKNVERIGEIMAYEISKSLAYKSVDVSTPLGIKSTSGLSDNVVICSILRAGLALHTGLLNYFDNAESAFVSAYRHHPNNDNYFDILVEYKAAPSFKGKTLIIADPMLATGLSLAAVFEKIMINENPGEVHVAVVIAAPEGVAYLEEKLPDNCHLWIASLDDRLNEHKYIVSGTG